MTTRRMKERRYKFFMLLVAFVVVPPVYNFLAAGNFLNLILAYMAFWPVVIFLIFVYLFCNIGCDDNKKCLGHWIIGLYFCLPILMNGLSVLLNSQGYIRLSSFVFQNRYMSLPLFIIVVLVWCLCFGIVLIIKEKLSSYLSAGPNDPPVSPKGRDRKKTIGQTCGNDHIIEYSRTLA